MTQQKQNLCGTTDSPSLLMRTRDKFYIQSHKVYHPNLLEMIMDFESNHKYYIVTEKAKTDLLQYLRLKGVYLRIKLQ